MSNRLRTLTYNIHKCRGLDGRVQPTRIVEVLREIDADVIALQEVLSIQGSPEEHQAQFIAGELGFHACFGENRRHNGGGYGNLLLSRFRLLAIDNHYGISDQGIGCAVEQTGGFDGHRLRERQRRNEQESSLRRPCMFLICTWARVSLNAANKLES